MMNKFLRFFDKFEDGVRSTLSHYPIFYASLGGVGVILFWRGVWGVADILEIDPIISIVLGLLILLSTGLLVTEFLGNKIIITGLRGEKKLEEKTLREIEDEEMFLKNLKLKVDRIEKMIEKIEGRNRSKL